MKFKVGDKVKIVGSNLRDVKVIEAGCRLGDKLGYKLLVGGIKHPCTWWGHELELVESAPFTKNHLKDGMVVEYRNGRRRLVLNEKFIGEDGRTHFVDFNNDLTSATAGVPGLGNYRDFDIMKVYSTAASYVGHLFDDDELDLIWERKEEPEYKEMTVEEIEKKLGHKVKVVGNE